MAIRTYSVPTPIVGTDWHLTIPGPYPWTLLAVRAVLNNDKTPGTIPDETGNGHTLTTQPTPGYVALAPGPYAGGANNYSVSHPVSPNPINFTFAESAVSADFGSAALTVDGWWLALSLPLNTFGGDLFGILIPPAGQDFAAGVKQVTAGAMDAEFLSAGVGDIVHAAFLTPNVWHHVAFAYAAPTWSVYVDGALSFTTLQHPPLGRGTPNAIEVPGNRGLGTWFGSAAGVAYYTAALSGAQIAAHAAASSSWATYRAAVLADTPAALWGLNTIPAGPARSATLEITDGTHAVLDVAGGTITGTAFPYTWVWDTGGVGGLQPGAGAVSQVPLPMMTLPPGYVIQTKTLGIASTDQWVTITIWYDDGTGGPGGPGTVDYLDAIITDTGQTGAPGAGDYADQILIG